MHPFAKADDITHYAFAVKITIYFKCLKKSPIGYKKIEDNIVT